MTASPPGVHDSKKTADFRAKPGSIAHPNSPFQHSKERSPAFPLTSAFYFYTIFKFAAQDFILFPDKNAPRCAANFSFWLT